MKHASLPRRASSATGRKPTQTGAILDAIKHGAHSATQVHLKTNIPLSRVHSLLSYLRRKRKVKGFKNKIRLVARA